MTVDWLSVPQRQVKARFAVWHDQLFRAAKESIYLLLALNGIFGIAHG
jgi:hypothetical protein